MLILGHRGIIGNSAIWQNSLRAFEEALKTSDGFETDAVASKDGEIFLIHEAKYAHDEVGVEYCADDHLDADSTACLGAYRLDELDAADIKTLCLRDKQKIPTLKETLELVGSYPGKVIDIELKGHNVAELVLRLVQTSIADKIIQADQIMISSFNFPALEIVRKTAPEIKLGAIFIGAEQKKARLFPWYPDDPSCYTPLTEAELQDPLLQRLQPDLFVMPEAMLTEDTAALITKRYPKAVLAGWVYAERGGFNQSDLIARLQKLKSTGKIAAIMPDNPDAFKKAWLS